MKFLFWRYSVGILLMITLSTGYANELSFIVLKKLHQQPYSTSSWSGIVNSEQAIKTF